MRRRVVVGGAVGIVVLALVLVCTHSVWNGLMPSGTDAAPPTGSVGEAASSAAAASAAASAAAAASSGTRSAAPRAKPGFANRMLAMADPSVVGMNQTDLDRHFGLINATGAMGIRFDLFWRDIEPTPGSYQWEKYDRIVRTATNQRKPILLVLGQAPLWAAEPGCDTTRRCQPKDMAAFVRFAEAAVTRYAAFGVHDYELWNEPNISGDWWPTPDAGVYAGLVREICPRIKQKDPLAWVVTGGLALGNVKGISMATFARQFYQATPGSCFDAFAVHLYGPAAWTELQEVRAQMVAHGHADKRVWATEVGGETSGACGTTTNTTETRQVGVLTTSVTTWRSYPWAGPMFWSITKDVPAYNNYYGLFCVDGTPKPALAEFKKLVAS